MSDDSDEIPGAPMADQVYAIARRLKELEAERAAAEARRADDASATTFVDAWGYVG